MTWYRCGSGISNPTNTWYGTLAEYKALTGKSANTVYTIHMSTLYSGTFIGDTQINPVADNLLDYDLYIDCVTATGKSIYQTDLQLFDGRDFEIEFILGDSSYSGTQVLLGTTGVDFNIILNGTSIKLYGFGYNQAVVGTISQNSVYKIIRTGSTIKFYKDTTELTNTPITTAGTASGNIQLFGWSNGYWVNGLIKKLSFKYKSSGA